VSEIGAACCCGVPEPPACAGCAACADTFAWSLNCQVEYQFQDGGLYAWQWLAAGTMTKFGNNCVWSTLFLGFTATVDVFYSVGGVNFVGGCADVAIPPGLAAPGLYPFGSFSCSVYVPSSLSAPSLTTATQWSVTIKPPPTLICPELELPSGVLMDPLHLIFTRPAPCPTAASLAWAYLGPKLIVGDGCWVPTASGSCVASPPFQSQSTRFVGASLSIT
jgi:hypothetical protein